MLYLFYYLEQDCKRTSLGEFYVGSNNKTRSLRECVNWDGYITDENWTWTFPDKTVDKLKNYCRNPDQKPEGPWCYHDYHGSWEYCLVPLCQSIAFLNCICLITVKRFIQKGVDIINHNNIDYIMINIG